MLLRFLLVFTGQNEILEGKIRDSALSAYAYSLQPSILRHATDSFDMHTKPLCHFTRAIVPLDRKEIVYRHRTASTSKAKANVQALTDGEPNHCSSFNWCGWYS